MHNDSEHIHYSDDDLFNPDTHHETSDVNVRALLWFLAIFVVLGIATHIVLTFFYKGLSSMERDRPTQMLTQIERPAEASVPQDDPLLQPFPRALGRDGETIPPYRNTPATDLADMRRAEKQALESYGWVDQQNGIVRIPIEEAKRLVVQRGLPVQTGVPADAASPAVPDTGTFPSAVTQTTGAQP